MKTNNNKKINEKIETLEPKKDYQKKLKNLLIIDYKSFNSKNNTQVKKQVKQFIDNISHTIKLNDDGLSFKVKINNETLNIFKQFIDNVSSNYMSNMIKNVDDYQLKVHISTAFISVVSLDDVKNGNDYDIIWKTKTYKFLYEILHIINNKHKNTIIK